MSSPAPVRYLRMRDLVETYGVSVYTIERWIEPNLWACLDRVKL